MASETADLLDCRAEDVFIAQTGVIGEPIDVEKITAILPRLKDRLGGGWNGPADAIMTTDTFPKGAVRTAEIDGSTVTIAGIAKGSGMIAPDMATMLGFVFTDASIPSDVLQALLAGSAGKSFNSITVDSDTSTSDTLLAFATGRADHAEVTRLEDALFQNFRQMFDEVLLELHDVREPCGTLRELDRRFPDLMVGRSGWVCRVIEEGVVRAGTTIVRVDHE